MITIKVSFQIISTVVALNIVKEDYCFAKKSVQISYSDGVKKTPYRVFKFIKNIDF